MKKTLIASAVAAATLSTGAFAADSGLVIYGDVEVAYTHADMSGTTDKTENDVGDNDSTLGFKHSHQISEGVTGFAKIEFEFDADEDLGESGLQDEDGDGTAETTGSGGINQTDEVYVGVKGDFGSIQYGVDETVYDWIDVVDTSENTGLGGGISNDSQIENLQYVSPEIVDGLVLGVTLPVESDSTYAGSLAAKYAIEGIEVALSYSMGRDEGTTDLGQNTIGLGASYTMDDITILGQFESEDETKSGADDNSTYTAIQGMYAMGQNQFALGYGRTNFGGKNGIEATWALQALHNVSDNMYVYLEYTAQTATGGKDGEDVDTLALGAAYSF